MWQHHGEGRVSAIARGRYLKLIGPAVAAQTDTPLLANDKDQRCQFHRRLRQRRERRNPQLGAELARQLPRRVRPCFLLAYRPEFSPASSISCRTRSSPLT